jgi:uncharacterized Zn finger protein
MIASAVELIAAENRECPDCGSGMEVDEHPFQYRDGWFVQITCPECGRVDEVEIDARNEAAIRY